MLMGLWGSAFGDEIIYSQNFDNLEDGDIFGKITMTDLPQEPFKCFALGTGCMLIKMSVFDKIEKPYFYYGDAGQEGLMSEDVYFCDKAHQAGYDVWCDPTIEVGHVGKYIY